MTAHAPTKHQRNYNALPFEPDRAADEPSRHPRVLLVEQCGPRAALVADTLRTFSSASNCVHRLDAFEGARALGDFDLVICGPGDTRETRLHPIKTLLSEASGVPVIFLTPPDEPALGAEALDLGAADALLTTPGYLEQLPLRVARAWRTAQRENGVAKRVASLARTVADIEKDNTELKRLLAQFQALATTDTLTGLPNRRAVEARLVETLSLSSRLNADMSVMMIDLDGFKMVNDTLGHEIGDELLRAVAVVLRQVLRRSDIAARLGGDEFVVLMPHTSSHRAAQVAQRIQQQFERFTSRLQHTLDGVRNARGVVMVLRGPGRDGPAAETKLGMTIGISSLADFPEATPEQLVGAADRAMYKGKRQERGSVCIAERSTDDPAGLALAA